MIMKYQEIINLIDDKIVEVARSKTTFATFARWQYDRITKASKNALQYNSEPVTNTNDKEIPKERYISPEEKQEIIDNLEINVIV